ncbi:MAG: DUF1428 domain-containing protein [Pirellulaceae bacterium]|jgi:uncharacterized protein YbaA (DUF1428 family)|nr:DUF1428 domain-containing protein [Pirellulaceae bacterium]
MSYIDGFVIPVPTENIQAYIKMSKMGGKIWMEHGALAYCECVGDDLDVKFGTPFPKTVKAKPGETVVFAYIVYKSRAHRDKVNAKVMADPRMKAPPNGEMPFDMKRIVYGGFKSIVDL